MNTDLEDRHLRKWNSEGYIGPCTSVTEEEMAPLRKYIYSEIIHKKAPASLEMDPYYCRHLDNKLVAEICCNVSIKKKLVQIFGSEIILWMSEFILKRPGARKILWHQDVGTSLEPMISATVWMAIDEATVENGCLQILPSNEDLLIQHEPSVNGPSISLDSLSLNNVRDITLRPGEYVIFKCTTIHGSRENSTTRNRLGLTFRVTTPDVMIKKDSRFFDGYQPITM